MKKGPRTGAASDQSIEKAEAAQVVPRRSVLL
jgi:hypothetical protein